jgi:cytochrome c oxidase assembly protein subunit 11
LTLFPRLQGPQRTLAFLLLCLAAMSALAWSTPKLYRIFCQATGLNGTTGRSEAAPGAVSGQMVVAFDTNVAPNMPWRFAPEAKSDTVDIGARDMAFFTATNTSSRPITGTATFNVQPDVAGKYFKKIQCFCFTQQTLQPGETARMPVIFYVDPAILADPEAKDLQKITLSYTFWPADSVGTGARTAHDG